LQAGPAELVRSETISSAGQNGVQRKNTLYRNSNHWSSK
jgi:hypothetical protein